MNTIDTLLQHPFVSRLGWTLIHFLWQGSAIALAFAGAQLALKQRSAQARYIAGCVALAAMVAAFAITFAVLSRPAIESSAFAMPVTSSARDGATEQAASETPTVVWTVSSDSWARTIDAVLPWLVLGWILGVASLSIQLIGGWLRIQRLRTQGVELPEEPWARKLEELKQRLAVSRPVRLLKSALVEVPTVIGWLQPVILLPATVLTGLTPEQLESILAHELAHIRRNDYLVNLCQRLIETFLFYHPAVWWVSKCIREEREHCCDDLVVRVCGNRMAYVTALASLESLRVKKSELALAASGGSLLERIRRLLGMHPGGGRLKFWRFVGLLSVVTLIAFGVDQITAPTIYRGTAKILVRRMQEPPSLFPAGLTPDALSDPYWLQTELERIGSNVIMEQVVEIMGLGSKWCPNSESPIQSAVDLLRKRVHISAPRQGNIFTVSIECADAREVQIILEAWFERYKIRRADSDGGINEGILISQNDRLRHEELQLRAELIVKERDLDNLKTSGEPNKIADSEISVDDLKRRLERCHQMRVKLEAVKEDADLRAFLGSSTPTTLLDRHVEPVKLTLLSRLFR